MSGVSERRVEAPPKSASARVGGGGSAAILLPLYSRLVLFPQPIMRKIIAAVFAALAAATYAANAAESFPNRPVRLMVPYPAGGPNDVLARMVGGKLAEGWGQQVVTDNRPGAGGNLAMELAARAPADGYTMVLPAMAYAVNPLIYSKVPYAYAQF